MIKGDVYLNAGDKLSPYVDSYGDSDFYVYSESGFSVHQIHTSAAFHAEKTGQKIGFIGKFWKEKTTLFNNTAKSRCVLLLFANS